MESDLQELVSNIGGQNKDDMAQCSQCCKKFASKKALFGHMRTHPTRPPAEAAPVSGRGPPGALLLVLAAGDAAAAAKKRRKSGGTVRAHECTVCHRVFGTGQALGGHKRCHWGGGGGGGCSRAGSGQSEPFLDLNEPAPLCEEDMEAAYGMLEVVPACQESARDILMISGWY